MKTMGYTAGVTGLVVIEDQRLYTKGNPRDYDVVQFSNRKYFTLWSVSSFLRSNLTKLFFNEFIIQHGEKRAEIVEYCNYLAK